MLDGVDAEVYRGYETTFARTHGFEALGMDLNLSTDMYTVHAEYLEAVLRRIDEMAGSVEQFLLETMQLTAREFQYLRDAFTESLFCCRRSIGKSRTQGPFQRPGKGTL